MNKKIIYGFILIIFTVCLLSGTALASSNGLVNGYGIDGTTTNAGSSTNPYAINDLADLQAISSSNWGTGVYYQQTADIKITSSGILFNGISGTYNGDGYIIDGDSIYGFQCINTVGTFTLKNIEFDNLRQTLGNSWQRSIIYTEVQSSYISAENVIVKGLSCSDMHYHSLFVCKYTKATINNVIVLDSTLSGTNSAVVCGAIIGKYGSSSSQYDSSISNCVVISTDVEGSGTNYRIGLSSTLSNNYASSDCVPTSSSTDADSKDGATITATEYNSQTWWEDTALYDFSSTGAWEWDSTTLLPKLKHSTSSSAPTINSIELTSGQFIVISDSISATVDADPSTEGLTLSYQWAYSTNAAVSWSNISGQTSATLSYTPQTAGTYYFKVYVSDSGGTTDSYTAGFTNVFVKVLNVYTPGNVSTKTSSIQAKTLETYQATNEFDFGSTIIDVKYVDDTTAYVAAGNAIYVVDGTGATISPLTTYTGNTISSVYLGSTRAIINDVDNNVAVYDYTAKTMEYIATDGTSKVAISPNYAYVVNDTGYLNIYNSSNQIVASMQYTYSYLEVNQESEIFGYNAGYTNSWVSQYAYAVSRYIDYYSFDGTTISSHRYTYYSATISSTISGSHIAKPIDNTNDWVLSGSNLDIYIIGITSAGAGSTTVHITTAYTPNHIDVAETLSSIFNVNSVMYVYGDDATLQGQYSAGGNLNDVSLSHSNALYAIGAGNDSNAYFINKESSSSWVLGQATNFKTTVYHSQMSYDGQQALIGTTNKLFLFKYSESVESTYYINGVVVGSDGLPYANKIITIDATSITTDDSGFFVYPVKPGQTYTIITGSKTTKYTATNQALQTLSIKITSQLVAQDVTYGASYNSTSSNIEMNYNDAADKTSIVVWSVRDTKTGAEVSRQSVSAGTQAYYFVPSNKTSDNYFVTVSATRGNTSVKNTWSITPSGQGQSVNLFGMDDTGKNILFGFFIILLAGLFGYLHQHIGTIIVAFAAAILRYLGLITVPWIMIIIAVVVAIVAAIAHRGEGK